MSEGSSISWHTAEAVAASCEEFLHWYQGALDKMGAMTQNNGMSVPLVMERMSRPHARIFKSGTSIWVAVCGRRPSLRRNSVDW